MQKNPLDEVRSRLVIMIFFGVYLGLAILISGVVDTDNLDNMPQGTRFAMDNLLGAISYLAIGTLLWQISSKQRDELAELMFNIPDSDAIRAYVKLSFGIVIFSIGLTYLFYYPLSLIAPDWVQSWLLDTPGLMYWNEEGVYLLGNLTGIFLAVIMAPIIEEFLFRGYLLNRWTLKFGALPATLLSAGLFGILHPDMLGAFVFALLMSLLYMKTRSLAAPILVHMANNVIAIILEWLDHSFLSGFEQATIADFQDYLWLGAICLVVGGYWVWGYIQRNFMPIDTLLSSHEKGDSDNYFV